MVVAVSVGSYIGSLGSIPEGADGLLVVFLPFLTSIRDALLGSK